MFGSTLEVTYPQPGAAVVELNGEYDIANVDELHECLEELVTSQELLVVDVSKSTFIDSRAIHALLQANAIAAERGTVFRLQLHTEWIVRRALEITGVFDLVEVASTREDALKVD